MGKSTHFFGQPVYGQLIKSLDRDKIVEMSRKNGGAKYVKNFNGFTHLLTMLYAVIMRFDSLREIEAAMTAEDRKEREARLAEEKQDRYWNILNRFIAEGRAALRVFALTTRTNFNDKEATSIYYGVSWLLPVKWN